MTDLESLSQAAAGDVSAVASLYERHASMLLAVSLRIVGDRAEAEDVVHDAFVSMRERASHFAPGRGSAVAWLATLVRNASLDRARVQRRRGVLLARAAAEPVRSPGAADQLLAEASEGARVRSALARLSAVQRKTLQRAFFDDLSYPEIAERDAVPLGTIKSRAARAMTSLREALEAV